MDEQTFLEICKQWISIPYLLAFIFFSFSIFKKFKIEKIKLWKLVISKTWIAFIFAALLAVPFYFLEDGQHNVIMMKLIISYAVATSFYELGIRRLEKLITKKTED